MKTKQYISAKEIAFERGYNSLFRVGDKGINQANNPFAMHPSLSAQWLEGWAKRWDELTLEIDNDPVNN